ncbi:hypothetical protein VitviT2T_001310 [Vitis vinifera]|uniref:Ycf15 n=1 Tax=Vitis vinifera TaxID=29760 RepID=A0ABY9BFJ0_VITVI|nr:hypothetical protein VitviT2T_001310 [Vitis vinifera]
MRVQLHYIVRIHVVYLKEKRLTSLLLSWYNPLPAEPPFSPFLLGPQRQNIGLVPTVHHVRKGSLSPDH